MAVGAVFLRRAPAVSLALFGSLLGAVAGFLVGNADGPAEVPAYTAVGASVGLVSNGVMGMFTTSARPPSSPLRRAALVVLIAAPFAVGALTLLVLLACPLYVSGKSSGFCNYQGIDLMGGWVSGVIVAFLFDGVFVAGLLLWSARQARRFESGMSASGASDRARILGRGGRARRGASGALYPQSASAGLNPRPRPGGSEAALGTERRWSGPARRQPVNPVRSGRKQP